MFKGSPKQVETCSLSTPQEPIPVGPFALPDLLSNLPSMPAAAWLGNPPSRQETEHALNQLRERPGQNNVLRVLTALMKTLWVTPA